jgi:nucleotide-binding universal stress UspA family protein
MKIVFAADGSKYTKKALAFLVTHETLCGPGDELVVLNVQAPVPPRVRSMLGADAVGSYHEDEARKVLGPIERFLKRHSVPFAVQWAVGPAGEEIVKLARKRKADMIVMGTHGHGAIGRALLGSVAQRVVTDSEVPVLLVK